MCVLLLGLGCGPVVLGEEEGLLHAGTNGNGGSAGAAVTGDVPSAGVGSGVQDAGPPPAVTVRIKPVDCGTCFELQAEGSGGRPPYAFEWEDGSLGAQRRVCTEDMALVLSVVALDAADSRSSPQMIRLESAADASCAEPMQPTDASPAAELCLENPSLEGTPVDFTQPSAFDAPPWSACTNPERANMPMIGNDTVSLTSAVPPPADGMTYLGLGEGDQVSQALCSDLPGGVPVHLQRDLARVDLGGGVVPQTEQVFLEIWGGLSVDCSQRELLWASPGLQTGWRRFCVTLQPSSFMTQLTLRGNADMTSASPAYLIVDNLQPVAGCP